MMKLRLICCFGLFLSLNFLIDHTHAQGFICNSLEGYDTHSLTKAYQWKTTPDYNCLANPAADCTFYFSFCQLAPACFNEYSACENSSVAANVTILGGLSTKVFYEYESGQKGFYAKFPAGPSQNISNGTECAPSLRINFICDLNAHWLAPIGNETANAPEPEDVDFDTEDRCLTIVKFNYAGACFNGTGPDTTPIPDKKDNGIGGGAIFLIILFSIALAYFLVGIAYNACVNHQSGVSLIPQAQFWIGLPLNAIEGCRTTIGLCSCSSREKSGTTYESV